MERTFTFARIADLLVHGAKNAAASDAHAAEFILQLASKTMDDAQSLWHSSICPHCTQETNPNLARKSRELSELSEELYNAANGHGLPIGDVDPEMPPPEDRTP